MVLNLFLIFVITIFLYAYLVHQVQFSATASAIRQIWTGSCRLSCRQSEYSYSGIVGLVQDSLQSSHAGPSNSCICESCPCALIEDVLRRCSPATDIYSVLVSFISTITCMFVQMVGDTLESFARIIECRAACQRQAQLKQPDYYESEVNFNFSEVGSKKNSCTEKDALKIEEDKPTPEPTSNLTQDTKQDNVTKSVKKKSKANAESKTSTAQAGSSKDERPAAPEVHKDKFKRMLKLDGLKQKNERKSDSNIISPTSYGSNTSSVPVQAVQNKVNRETTIDLDKSKRLSEHDLRLDQDSSCPKCVQKGKTCISSCPNAKKG